MKTTIEIADAVLSEARQRARRDGTTLRALVEDGLRRVLEDDVASPDDGFRVRVFSGGGPARGIEAGELVDRSHDLHGRERFPELFEPDPGAEERR